MTSFTRKRTDRARHKKRAGRTPDILRKSGPHRPKKERDLVRTKLEDWEVDYNDTPDMEDQH